MLGNYSLKMTAVPIAHGEDGSDPAEAESEAVATIGFKLNALFTVEHEPDDEPFSESAFGQTTGQFAHYPYARELVANATGRMGLTPLHMGVMRLHLETRDG